VRIVLTHAHYDHVGSLDALHAALPTAEVLVPEREARFLAGDLTLDVSETVGKLRGGWHTCSTQPTRLIHAGDVIGSLEAIDSPGHTPGHVAYIDRRTRALIAGDAFQTRAGIAVSGVVRPLFPFPAFATWHKPTAARSARTLREVEPSLLAVGHGRVLLQPGQAMDRAIAIAEH
jgi:glyoxylase-like metal-dependent hydrolase (beta-lactamase superfamily II)